MSVIAPATTDVARVQGAARWRRQQCAIANMLERSMALRGIRGRHKMKIHSPPKAAHKNQRSEMHEHTIVNRFLLTIPGVIRSHLMAQQAPGLESELSHLELLD